jgi:acetylornithine deacetylase/succinyl-diaminopimelate desuccinylase-like protein
LIPDWRRLREETVAQLQKIIQFDTTNPPGNELPLALYLQSVLDAAGIETRLLEPSEGRAALIARIRGDGSRRPVMLLAHMDVVGVERENWTRDPFAGHVADGYLYGRGAIDDKGMLAANLISMLALQQHLSGDNAKPRRDILFVATSDEEAGGEWGMGWLIEHHSDLLDAEYAINEGGRTRIIDGGRVYLAVQSAEKISHVVTITAHGSAGHAAIPLEDNAIFRLSRAMEKLSGYAEPVVLTEITRQFFARLAGIWPREEEQKAMIALGGTDRKATERGAAILSKIAVFNAVLRNGISPTILQGGNRYNVIPASAGAVLNVRTIPGQSIDDAIGRMRKVIDDDGIQIEVTQRGVEAPASDPSSEMFTAISDAARGLNPEIAVVPYLSTGVTDSARLRQIGVQAYGVLPFPMEQSDEERMHGHDERVPLESLHFGTRLIFEAVKRVAFQSA